MMNRLVYSALAIFCFAVVSCVKETPISDYSRDHIVLNVFNSPMTKAEGDSSTNYEKQLKRLDCFFYVKDKTHEPCVYYHKAEIDNLGSATIPFAVNDLVLMQMFPSGSECDVFIIANLPEDYRTFEANTPGTDMQSLGTSISLDMGKGEYDVVGKPFVMTGFGQVHKGQNSNASANISLARVASKVTMTVKVPKSIEVKEGESMVTMFPVLVDNEGNEPLKTSFNYGAKKSYLSEAYPDDPENYIKTDKFPYTRTNETDTHYVFTCEVPFYTYARSWEKGSMNAAYVTFEMPWGKDLNNDNVVDSDYQTYYYQILVNGNDRNFTPNTRYDMIVTVGVLGSIVESRPYELDEYSYYVLDWTEQTSNGEYGSGDRNENVEIDKFNYLEVPQTYIEMNNVDEVAIRYDASHKIGVKFNTTSSKSVEGLPSTTKSSAFYINNESGAPQEATLPNISIKDNFTDNNKGLLTFNYTLPDGVYSPAYVFITIWLDVDGDGVHDSDEVLEKDVKITIYPAIYIIGDNSYDYSIFVNGYYNKNQSSGNNLGYLSINNQRVGKAAGDDDNTYMHVISISAFSENNYTFVYTNNQKKEYIIGDPRVRSSNKLDIPDDTNNTAGVNTANPTRDTNTSGWIQATDVDGTVRNLQYYYPTSTEANSYQVIAPKFRIASKLGGYSNCSPKGAALRCASYQEHGFPAGRWRLPTTAEILYIVELQRLGKIQQLFYGGNTYFSATDRVTVPNNNNYTLTTGLGNNNNSVRCVYDEWYWGSEREAIKNSSYNNHGGYQFTWGDREVY